MSPLGKVIREMLYKNHAMCGCFYIVLLAIHPMTNIGFSEGTQTCKPETVNCFKTIFAA